MGRLGTADYNGHSPSVTCHHLTTVHLPCTAGTVYSYASSVFWHLGPCQTKEIQDTASLGQEGEPLWPIWLWLGREMRRRMRWRRKQGRQAGTTAYWYHCNLSVLNNSQGAQVCPGMFFRPAVISLSHSHRLWPAMYEQLYIFHIWTFCSCRKTFELVQIMHWSSDHFHKDHE